MTTHELTVTFRILPGDTAATIRDIRANLPALIRSAWGVDGEDLMGFDGALVDPDSVAVAVSE